MIKKLLFLLPFITIGFISRSQYCATGGPTSTIDSNVESVTLNGALGSINYTGCPGATGVELALAQTTTLNASNSYMITIQFGTCGGNFSGVGQAWIDYNLNNVFEASESIGTWQGTPPTTASVFNFTVPLGAINGTSRLRVMQYEGGSLPLDPCASFTWGSVVDFTIVIQGGGGGGNTYCNGGPSQTADSNVESVALAGNTTNINYTGCPGATGVQNVSQSADLGAGMSYSMDVQFGTCGGNFAGVGEAWIDFNSNGTYEAAESIGTWQGTPPTAMSQFNFTVPPGAVQGSTKMRIAQQESGTLPINPCGTYTWGSMMDFNIEIVQGVDCSTYQGDVQSDAIVVTALPYTHNNSNAICYSNQHLIYSSADVYYAYPVQAGDEGITASLCGSSFDTYMTITDKYGNILNANDDHPSCGTSSQCTVNVMGYDTVYVIVEGWGSLTGDYTLNINAIDLVSTLELKDLNSKIFPNPTSGILNIVSGVQISEMTLRDLSGRIVIQSGAVNEINIENEPSGIYLLRIYYENGMFETHKISKK